MCIATDAFNATNNATAKAMLVIMSRSIIYACFRIVACDAFHIMHMQHVATSLSKTSGSISICPSQLLNYSEAMLPLYQFKWLLLLCI